VPQTAYAEHVRERRRKAEEALAAESFDALLISSGEPFRYFADDQDAPFRSTPHFAHWTPLAGPHHLLLVRPPERPRLVRVAPEDYWYEQAPLGDPFWVAQFDLTEVRSEAEAWKALRLGTRTAYVGDAPEKARAAGIGAAALNPAALVARLDWDRSYKTPYEVACIERAEETAARGHRAARTAFDAGGSELEIHQAYMSAAGCVDKELPYESIVALDEKGATLHYVGKRNEHGGRVLLIDSGARHNGYCSDITRTWTRPGCDAVFRELVQGVDDLQRALCADVRPGVPYPDVHARAHGLIGDLLHASGLLRVDGEEAVELGLTRPFFPHGVGHFLGLQVHDVAGHQSSASGGKESPPPDHPFLRTTRRIEERQVFTIEPGLYFIEMLLREHRAGPRAELFDWALVERLKACGGIRIEDNVVVTASGHRNLTRPYI